METEGGALRLPHTAGLERPLQVSHILGGDRGLSYLSFMFREMASKKQGVGAGRKEKAGRSNPRMQMNGKNLIEVQPSPSPEN